MRSFLILMIFTLFVTACGGSKEETAVTSPEELQKIVLPMGYIPDPQYAPYYVAVENGYFADEGLEIEFDYSFETDGMAMVAANETQFAIAGGDAVILARAQDLPVVYVFEWFQKYPIAIVSKSAANIANPADLVGREVGIPGFFGASYMGYAGTLAANDIDLADVSATEVGFNQIETLLTDQAEAVVVFANNEPLQLQNMGEDVNVIQAADYVDMVFNGIVTNEETINNNPELVEGFLRALTHGLQDTLDDPDAAYEISKSYVEGLDDSRRDVLEASLLLWNADVLGVTEAASWLETQETLMAIDFLDAPLSDLEAAYTNTFVEK